MASGSRQTIERKIDVLVELLQNLLAIELSNNGVTQEQIGKRLHIAKSRVVEMLKGVKREA